MTHLLAFLAGIVAALFIVRWIETWFDDERYL